MSVCRILIVEDEAIVAMDLEGRLARMDYQPLGRVSSGEEALAFAGDRLEGHHVLGKSILEGQPFVCNSPRESFCLCSPEQPPGSMPFQSCASLPIRFQGKVHYVLTLCTAEREFFQEREVRLLEEVALDISYALDKMESDSQREAHSERCRSQPEFFQALLDAMPLPAFYKDVRLRYLGCNKAFEGLLGMSRDQLIGRTTHELWPLDLAKTYRGADQELLMSSLPQVYDAAVVKPDGTRTPVRFYKSTFNDRKRSAVSH